MCPGEGSHRGYIWKYILGKSPTSATNVILHLLGRVVWGYIWYHTTEKSLTNVECFYLKKSHFTINVTLKQNEKGHLLSFCLFFRPKSYQILFLTAIDQMTAVCETSLMLLRKVLSLLLVLICGSWCWC